MEIIIYQSNFEKRLRNKEKKYKNIILNDNELKRILEFKKNIDYFELGSENVLEIVLKKHKLENCELLLIQTDNYNSVIEFKNEFKNEFITIINENIMDKEEDVLSLYQNNETMEVDVTLEDCVISDSDSDEIMEVFMSEIPSAPSNEISLEKLENITDKECVLSKILDLKLNNIYCLISDNSEMKRRKISAQIGKLNISVEFVIINKEEYERNNLLLHLKCIKKAKSMNYKNILIMEEDNEFNYPVFHQYLNNSLKVPSDFEMLYLGGQILNGDVYDENLICVKSIIYNHAYVVNYKIFDYIIENIEKEWNTIDNWDKSEGLETQIDWNDGKIDKFYSKHICAKRKKSYCVYPLLCYKESKHLGDNKMVVYKENMEKTGGFFYKKLCQPISVFVMNEEKNEEQLSQFREMANENLNTFNIFKSVTNYDYLKEIETLKIFNLKNIKENQKSHNYDVNKMNNALSHYYLWEHFSKNEKIINLILEDNIEMEENFNVKLNKILIEMINYKWDILFLNYQNDNHKENQDSKNILKLNEKNKNNKVTMKSAYLININSGKKIMKYIKTNKIKQSLNHLMMEFYDDLNCYKLKTNICSLNSKIQEKENLLDINNVNELINPEEEKIILNEEVNNEDFMPLLIDNDYKEVMIHDNIYFKNSNNILFQMNDDDELCYHGYIKNNKIVVNHLNKDLFKMSIKKVEDKESIIVYLNENSKIPHFYKKIIELLSLKYQVIVIGKNLYNIKINDVYYISTQNDEFLNKMIKTLNIKKIYTDNYNILLLITKSENIEMNFIMYEIPTIIHYQKKLYKNNGIEYMRNTYDIFDNIYFFNKNLMEEYKDQLNLNEIPENFKLNSFALSKNENKIKLGMKQKMILSIDKHPKRVVNAFKNWNKKMNGCFKLIILNNSITELNNEDITIDKLNYMNFNKYLDQAYFFITFENNYNTYYNIYNAINHYCIPIIPKYFSEFNNKFITFNGFLNRFNLIDMQEIYENSQKKMIYNNLCDNILKNHLLKMSW
jgi:GR25 family glycosyltransferase involved in LPS biosynthesis